MKKFGIFAAAFAILASASCMEETIAPETVTGDGASFTATRADYNGATKTVLVDGCKVEWKAGDQIALFNTKGTSYTETGLPATETWRRCFPFNTQNNGSSARFVINSTDNSAKAEGAQPYLFLYPYDWSYLSYMDSDHMMCRFWLTDQAATLGSFDPKYAPAVAKSQTLDEKVVFKNLLPLLKFTVPASLDGRINKITVTSNNPDEDGFVAGNMICDYTGDTPVVKVFSEFKEGYKYKGGSPSVALRFTKVENNKTVEDPTPGMATGDYYLAIAPKTYSEGITITVRYTDGTTSTRSSSSSVELRSGVIYDMGNVGAENYSGPGIALPYVFSFFAGNGTINIPKYVTTETVTTNTHYRLADSETGSLFDVKTTGTAATFWANKWRGHDGVIGQYFTTQESAGDKHKESYYMLTVPLRVSLPQTFRVSFGFFIDKGYADAIKDWKLEYSKDATAWYDGDTYEFEKILKCYSSEITSQVTFNAGDNLYLRWIPVGSASTSGVGTTTGMESGARVLLTNGIVISDIVSRNSVASGNVYAEDFDRINGGVDYHHAGQEDGIEKLGLLGELFGSNINTWNEEQKNGLSGSNIVERPGYVQIGYATCPNDDRNVGSSDMTKYVGSLLTPALKEATGTIKLSFKAMCYKSPFYGRAGMSANPPIDITDIVVNIKGEGSFNPSSPVTSMTLSGISTSGFDTQNLTIYNSDATTQIEFTSPANTDKFTRWFLDDICVNKAE